MEKKLLKPSLPKEKTFHIDLWAIAFFITMITLVASLTVKSVEIYKEWRVNWDVVYFAKNNPEIVRNMQKRYNQGLEELKQELVSVKPEAKEFKLEQKSKE